MYVDMHVWQQSLAVLLRPSTSDMHGQLIRVAWGEGIVCCNDSHGRWAQRDKTLLQRSLSEEGGVGPCCRYNQHWWGEVEAGQGGRGGGGMMTWLTHRSCLQHHGLCTDDQMGSAHTKRTMSKYSIIRKRLLPGRQVKG